MQYKVTFDVLVEARTDTFMGASRSDLSNQTVVVEAISPNHAQQLVEAMYGGRQNVVVKFAHEQR